MSAILAFLFVTYGFAVVIRQADRLSAHYDRNSSSAMKRMWEIIYSVATTVFGFTIIYYAAFIFLYFFDHFMAYHPRVQANVDVFDSAAALINVSASTYVLMGDRKACFLPVSTMTDQTQDSFPYAHYTWREASYELYDTYEITAWLVPCSQVVKQRAATVSNPDHATSLMKQAEQADRVTLPQVNSQYHSNLRTESQRWQQLHRVTIHAAAVFPPVCDEIQRRYKAHQRDVDTTPTFMPSPSMTLFFQPHHPRADAAADVCYENIKEAAENVFFRVEKITGVMPPNWFRRIVIWAINIIVNVFINIVWAMLFDSDNRRDNRRARSDNNAPVYWKSESAQLKLEARPRLGPGGEILSLTLGEEFNVATYSALTFGSTSYTPAITLPLSHNIQRRGTEYTPSQVDAPDSPEPESLHAPGYENIKPKQAYHVEL